MEQPSLVVYGGRKHERLAPFHAQLPRTLSPSDAQRWADKQRAYLAAGAWVPCHDWSTAAAAHGGPYRSPSPSNHAVLVTVFPRQNLGIDWDLP